MVEKDLSCLSVSGVYFTCPLTGATLTKSEREVHIKEAILMVRLEIWRWLLSTMCLQHDFLMRMSFSLPAV